MSLMSSAQAQQLLAYLVVDHTGVMRKRLSLIKQQLASLENQLDSNSATRSRVQLEVVVADFADYGTAEITDPTSSQRLLSSDSAPGCDLGEALREILNSLHKKEDEGTGENSKVEVIVLLAGEPSGDWEGGIRALAQRGARVSAVAFASTGVLSDETLKKIATQLGGALRLNLFDDETAKKAFSWVGELLQQSVKSMGQAPIAKPRAASSPPRVQATPRPVTVPPSPAAESPVAYPPQEALTAPEPVAASPLPVAGPSPVSSPQEARVAPVAVPPPQAPVSPEVGEAPVSAEDAVPPARGPEPPRADSQERLPEEAALDLEAKEDMQREERKAMLEESALPAPDTSPLKEEGVPVGTVGPEQPEVAPPVEEVVDLEVEVAPAEEGAPVEAVIEPEPEPPPVTKDGVATIWEDREPTDPTDPVDHTDPRMLEAPDGWRIVGASRRGKMHAHKGIYREDAFAFGETNGWHLVVVADGGGSCPLSRVGSQLAADTAVATMARFASIMKNDDRTIAKEICEIALRRGAEEAWKALQKATQERNRS
ncbi:MAG: protein phosphatase 2C domain-containing protein, partial [Ardenticatenia bacterium]|nr:protein phosphatase 2C domain-containing protein [Ardenticatenia bacterium]